MCIIQIATWLNSSPHSTIQHFTQVSVFHRGLSYASYLLLQPAYPWNSPACQHLLFSCLFFPHSTHPHLTTVSFTYWLVYLSPLPECELYEGRRSWFVFFTAESTALGKQDVFHTYWMTEKIIRNWNWINMTATHFRRLGVYLAMCGMKAESESCWTSVLSYRVDDMPSSKPGQGVIVLWNSMYYVCWYLLYCSVGISCTISLSFQLDCKLMVGREHCLCYFEFGTCSTQFSIPRCCPDILVLEISWAVDYKCSLSAPQGQCSLKWEEDPGIQTQTEKYTLTGVPRGVWFIILVMSLLSMTSSKESCCPYSIGWKQRTSR